MTRCDCLIILLFLDFEKIYASLGIVVNDHSHEEEDDHAHQKRVKTQESVWFVRLLLNFALWSV